jgi:multidrug efflux pump subunit AcrB
MHQPFTAPSIIGLLALSGVVVRSSLLIIDFTLGYIAEGKTVREAVVQSVEMRTRPIVLTALAVVLGIAIMLTDPVFGGLAITLIFGTTVSTVMTLIVIPLILYLYLTIVKKRLR